MSIKKSQAKCTENIGPPVILVFSTPLTGSQAEKSSKCPKTWFRFLSPA